jgi:TP901 family phage tail tape measure protein
MADLGFLGGGLGATIGKAIVQLELDTAKYTAEMRAAQAQTEGSSKAMAASLSSIGTVGLASIGIIGGLSIKAALDFDKSFTRIAAISNTSAEAIASMKEEVLALSGETAQSPTELADALYFLSSAGLDAAEVMPALEASAQASAVGLGETADVANILASALNAYAGSGLTAAAATDVLVAAVREGRAEPEEFANALGRILPIASTVGVSFDQVAASMAALSNIGLDVNEGVTAMRGVLQAVAAPGTAAAEALDELGLSSQQLLDAISEDGIIGALRLLDAAAKAQTDTQADYNNVLRQVIPNVRSLTGVLGLTVQESEKVDAIFDAVKNSSGALGDAFRTTAESDAFAMQKALNDLVVEATKLGRSALPAVTAAFKQLAPVATEVFENLDVLLALFLAFKAGGVAAALGAETFGAALGPIAGIIAGAVIAGRQLNDVFYGTDQTVEELAASITGSLKPALDEGVITYAQYAAALQFVKEGSFENVEAALEVQAAIAAAAEAEARAASTTGDYAEGVHLTAVRMREYGVTANEADAATRGLSDAATKAMKDFKQSVVESVQVSIGQFESLADAFDTTPTELQKQMDLAITIARREQRTLREIFADDSLSKAQKEALADLPANQREAWAAAGEEGKKQIEKDAVTLKNLNERTFREITNAAKPVAREGGKEIGRSIPQGAALGVDETAPALATAVREAVRKAIDAGKAEAGAASPSKEMAKLGVDMMVGLADGISDAEQKAIDAAAAAIGKLIDRVSSELDRAQGRMDEFAGAIESGFSSFADIGGAFGSDAFEGASLETVIQAQLAGAQQLADVLEALKRQGASQALLAEVAAEGASFGQELLAGGPEQINEANEALKTIAELSKETGKALSESFFGNRVDRLENKLDRLHDDLRELNELERRGHSHDVLLDGEKVSTTTEVGLTRILDRRGSLFDGAVKK